MTSIVFGSGLLLYLYYNYINRFSRPIHIDAVLWTTVWGLLFFLNGLLGYVYIQNPVTDIIVFIYVLLFLFGHQLVMSFGRSLISEPVVARESYGGRLFVFVVACSIVGLWLPYEVFTQGGQNAGGGDYAETIRSINSDIRNGEIEQSLLGKIAFSASQAVIAMLGIFIGLGKLSRVRAAAYVLISFTPPFLYTLTSTVRGPVFLALLLLISGVIAGKVILRSEVGLLSPKVVGILIAAVPLFLSVMVVFQSIRLGDMSFSRMNDTIEHLRIWFAGYIPALNGWIWDEWRGDLTFGASSFRFIGGLISGDASYVSTLQSNIYIGDWRYGNASTALRVILNDFGFFGCGLFVFLWGAYSAYILKKAKSGSIVWATILTFNIAAIVWSPNQWFFLYGSRVLAPLILVSYLLGGGIYKVAQRSNGATRRSVLAPTRAGWSLRPYRPASGTSFERRRS